MLASDQALLTLGELELRSRHPLTALVELERTAFDVGSQALELDKLRAARLDGRLGVAHEPVFSLELFAAARQGLFPLSAIYFLRGELGRAFAELFPQRRNSGASLLELGRALPRRLVAAALTFGERLPRSLQLPLFLGHRLRFCVRPRLPLRTDPTTRFRCCHRLIAQSRSVTVPAS